MFTSNSTLLSRDITTIITNSFGAIGNIFDRTLNQIIKSLFSNNEQGFFYDPNDLTTMFQDAAGTVPVTGVGKAVGLIRDKSGRNNHAYQTTSASRPILRQNAVTGANYLEFDGSDDALETANIDFTATDKVSLFTGVQVTSTSDAMLLEFSSDVNVYDGSFFITAPETTNFGIGYWSLSHGNVNANYLQYAHSLQGTFPDNAVLSTQHDISAALSTIRKNSVLGTNGTANKGMGSFGSYPLYIGSRGGTSLPFSGHLYSLIGIGRLTTDSETIALEKAIAKNVGVTLNV